LSSHDRLKLSDRRDVDRKVLHVLSILKMKGFSPVIMGEGFVDPFELYTTQTHIEADKLGLVLQKTSFEAYDVPIIVLIGEHAYKYIIDGHHLEHTFRIVLRHRDSPSHALWACQFC